MNEERSQEAAWLLKEKYAGVESPEYLLDLTELEAGVPLAYVIGWIPFLNTDIHLDSRPLIPRIETEYWVDKVIRIIKELPSKKEPLRILDLCAGSGAIGVAVLRNIPGAVVDFAEIERTHHFTILKNLSANHIDQKRVQVVGGDLFEKTEGEYDYILSNPPYIDPALRARVEESVALHEPKGALYGGEGGLELIYQIMREAPNHLVRGGVLFIEHEPEQTDAITRYAEQCRYARTKTMKDQYGHERVTMLVRG